MSSGSNDVNTLRLKFVDNRKHQYIPTRATNGSAGYDLFAPCPLALNAGLHKIPLGFGIKLPRGTFGNIKCRSSLAAKDMSVEAGVIDEDYTGEISVLLRVRSQSLICPAGKAIAQLIVTPYRTPELYIVNHLEETARGNGGFGSTDKHE